MTKYASVLCFVINTQANVKISLKIKSATVFAAEIGW